MSVGSPKAERTHARSPWQDIAHAILWCFPLAILLYDVEGTALQLDIRINLLTMQVLDQLLVLHLQQDFNDASDPGGQFQMPNMAFERAKPA